MVSPVEFEVTLAKDKKYIGIDIGGTQMRAALYPEEG
ncbi:MAG: hypothetical protein ACD_34C00294G0001, partial [uncultured bacterium]